MKKFTTKRAIRKQLLAMCTLQGRTMQRAIPRFEAGMFYECTNHECGAELDLRDITNTEGITAMFYACKQMAEYPTIEETAMHKYWLDLWSKAK